MNPRCCRCGTENPSPMKDDDGDLIYWFRLEQDDDGEEHLCSDPDAGSEDEATVAFTGITTKSFDYDGTYKLTCPKCASEECEYLKGDIIENVLDDDGWMEDGSNPFLEDPSEDDDDEEERVF